VMMEMGMSKGILGLRDYYKSRVLDTHKWIHKDCLKLRSEYASKIALKIGTPEQSNRTGKSVPSPGNNATTTSSARDKDKTENLNTLPASPSSVTPTNGSNTASTR